MRESLDNIVSFCMWILRKFLDYTYDKPSITHLIEGLENGEKFFMERLKNLYGENEIELNREVEDESDRQI